MSSPPPLPPSPPQPQLPSPLFLHKSPTPTTLPDFVFTAFSLFVRFSSSKPTVHLLHKFPTSISFPLHPRRFLRSPIMSLTPRKSPNPIHHFASPQSLSDWLKPRLPSDSFSAWGVKPGTKNVHNLWLELSEGETFLADSTPPVRTVEVVVVRVIGQDGKILIESQQQLSDGTIRNRSRPLSEKMKPGETVEVAAIRAVKEELGSVVGASFPNSDDRGIVSIVPNSYTKKVEERVSVSYPGLPASYVLHTVDAYVDGLPQSEFCTEEDEEYDDSDIKKAANAAVFCKKHYWTWVDSSSL